MAEKSKFSQKEEEILSFWEENKIFKKTLTKKSPKGDYVFYDGPPFATGLPHYGHIVASIMKDAIPRYRTMKGYRVERRWGWDCHGLPVENLAEKELHLSNKKDIEVKGVEVFNDYCHSIVLRYAAEWKKFVRRLARWVDMERDYKTMEPNYMESIWWVFKSLFDKGLIYEDFRVTPYCPRCGTPLSNFELNQPGAYREVSDQSVYIKFKVLGQENTYFLVWTTTPWTLPANVALAVGENIEYILVEFCNKERNSEGRINKFKVYLAKSIFEQWKDSNSAFQRNGGNTYFTAILTKEGEDSGGWHYPRVIKNIKGKDLVGLEYEPLFPKFIEEFKLFRPIGLNGGLYDEKGKKIESSMASLSENSVKYEIYEGSEEEKFANAFKVYTANFVSTEDGTGIVHIAPAFGEDDMSVGKAENLPTIIMVDPEGKIIEGLNIPGEGKFVKTADKDIKTADKDIKTDLGELLFQEEKIIHSYPFCWRCESPLLYYPLNSWYVAVTKIKDKVIANNKKINWVPEHLKTGRFGRWLEEIRDWAISRNRFWGAPIPVWRCQKCGELKVIGSIKELEGASGEKIKDLHKHIVDKIKLPCDKCGGQMARTSEVLDCWFESGSMPYAQFHYPFENKDKFLANFPAEFIAEGIDQTRGWFYTLLVLSSALFDKPAAKNISVNGIVLAEDGQKMSKSKGNYPDPQIVFDKYGADALRYYLFSSPVTLAENLNFSEKGVDEALKKVVILLGNVLNFYLMYETAFSKTIKYQASDNALDQWIIARLNQLIKEVSEALDNYNLPKAARPLADFINDLSTWYLRRSRSRFKEDSSEDKKQALATLRYSLYIISKLLSPFTPFIAEEVYQKVTGYDFKEKDKSVHLEDWPLTQEIDRKIIAEMEQVKVIVEQGLAVRAKAGIKIRQPLNYYSTSLVKKLSPKISKIIKDELNIKKLKFGKDELDTKIDAKLKEEGLLRDLTRLINNLRKDAGLTIKDLIVIYFESADPELKNIIKKYKKELKKNTLSKDLKEEKFASDEFFQISEAKIDSKVIKLAVKKDV